MIPLLECYFLIFSFLVCCKGLYNIYRRYECHTVVMTIFRKPLFQSVCVCVCVCVCVYVWSSMQCSTWRPAALRHSTGNSVWKT